MSRHCTSISVTMEDGSVVTLRAQLTSKDVKLSERDLSALREAIHQISARRMDPQRADRRRRVHSERWENPDQLCECGHPAREHTRDRFHGCAHDDDCMCPTFEAAS